MARQTAILPLYAIVVATFASAFDVDSFLRTDLAAFKGVEVSFPYSGKLVASPDDKYSVQLYAPTNISEAAKADISGGLLKFGLTGYAAPNSSYSIYNYTISVPKGSLSRFASDAAVSLSINGSAADSASFDIDVKAPGGSGKLAVTDLSSKQVHVVTVGFGSGYLRATPDVEFVDYVVNGTGSASVNGTSGTVNAYLDGPWTFQVSPSSESAVLNAYISGPNTQKVLYSQGSCTIVSMGSNATCINSSVPSIAPAVPLGVGGLAAPPESQYIHRTITTG